MILTWSGYRFELHDCWAERETAKAAGYHFDFVNRVWWTGIIENARIFERCADQKAKDKFGEEERLIASSRALTSNLNVPCKEGLEFYPFQKAAVEYCFPRKNTLIADQMGTGKSISSVGLINYCQEIKKVLVVCPASLRINWARELVRWLSRSMSGGFAYQKEFPDDTDIVIVNYELVKRFRQKIDQHHWDLVIYDEAHYMKSFQAQRTRACLGDADGLEQPIQADRRLFLTGTPILNRPFEIFPILKVADPDDLGISEYGFVERYCKAWEAPWGTEYLAKKDMMEDLQRRLRAKVMIRRLKSEVLPQLPAKRRQIIPLPPEAAKKTVQAELNFFNENCRLIEDAIQRAQNTQTGDDISFKEAADDLKRGRKALFTELASLRKATGIAKIPFVIEYLEQALEQEEKVVAFGHHREVLEKVAQHFGKKAVLLYGEMSDSVKNANIDRFQEDPSCHLFVGGITIAQGYTLTAASLCVVFELDWRPSIICQAEDRLHRIGQKNAVLIQHLCFDGSLDANMLKTIIQKQEIIEAALG